MPRSGPQNRGVATRSESHMQPLEELPAFEELRALAMSDAAKKIGLVVDLATEQFLDGRYLLIVKVGFDHEGFRAEPLVVAAGDDAIRKAVEWISASLAKGHFHWPPSVA